MNTIIRMAGLSLILGSGLLGGCSNDANSNRKADDDEGVIHQASLADREATHSKEPLTGTGALLYVNGLGCPLCATNIDKQLLRNKAIATADVDLGTGTVTISFKEGATKPTPDKLRNITLDAGFTLVKIEGR